MLALILVVSGCSAPTSSLVARIFVTARGTSLSVSADVLDGDGDIGDAGFTFIFRGAEHDIPRFRETMWDGNVTLDAPPAADELVTVAFRRGDGDDAPASTVTVPPPFVVDAIPPAVSRAQPFTVMWSPASDDLMYWRLSRQDMSYETRGELPAGASSVTIQPTDSDVGTTATTTMRLNLRRLRQGQVDPAFHASEHSMIVFAIERDLEFSSTP